MLTKGGEKPLQGVLVPLFGDVEDEVEPHLTGHTVFLQIPGDQQKQPFNSGLPYLGTIRRIT